MCGRFTLFESDTILSKEFDATFPSNITPRYNIAPTQQILAVRSMPVTRKREFAWLRWGLIPRWAKDPAIGNKMINARAETLAEKPAFRDAFKYRRCLIPASGFYEWKKTEEKKKQPFYVRMKNRRLFSLAGLWEQWISPDGSTVESCALITTESNETVSPLHNRMPLILSPAVYKLWLNAGDNPPDQDCLRTMIQPYPADEMEAVPVGYHVNDPKEEDPRCIDPSV